jgi:thiamine pyrophosphokinase
VFRVLDLPAGEGRTSATDVEVVVLVGGDPVPCDLASDLPRGAVVVAADSGLHLAEPLGLTVDLVVGDLDSVDPAVLAAAEAAGTRVERHPVAKAATDLQLALEAAVTHAPRRITVVGGAGGRLDHELSLWQLLASPVYAGTPIRAWSGRARTDVLHAGGALDLDGRPGELVSLVPVHGPARGVTTGGLLFPLSGEDLPAGSTRGVSNQFVATRASVHLVGGVLLAVRSGERGPPLPDTHTTSGSRDTTTTTTSTDEPEGTTP